MCEILWTTLTSRYWYHWTNYGIFLYFTYCSCYKEKQLYPPLRRLSPYQFLHNSGSILDSVSRWIVQQSKKRTSFFTDRFESCLLLTWPASWLQTPICFHYSCGSFSIQKDSLWISQCTGGLHSHLTTASSIMPQYFCLFRWHPGVWFV